jgi:hypothetical protein
MDNPPKSLAAAEASIASKDARGKVLGNYFKKITRISKEIELSSPCRAR